ncbi:hypothetical protein G7046_g5896 [Stylonectria norvegica]|nr:hypothetical protein G7046_g5896 [Stylonectria norvegica]
MGGKVWSEEEERVFWEVIVPQSPNAANPADRALSWKQCCVIMQETMGAAARREYTHTMLYEHHYQNFKPGPKSPKANRFLQKYLRDQEEYAKQSSPPPSPRLSPSWSAPMPKELSPATSRLNNTFNKAPVARMETSHRVMATQTHQASHAAPCSPGVHTHGGNREQQDDNRAARQPLPGHSLPTDVSQSFSLGRPAVRKEAPANRETTEQQGRSREAGGPLRMSGVVINHVIEPNECRLDDRETIVQYYKFDSQEASATSSTRSPTSAGSSNDSPPPYSSPKTTTTDYIDHRSSETQDRDQTNSPEDDDAVYNAAQILCGSRKATIQNKRKRSDSDNVNDECSRQRPGPFSPNPFMDDTLGSPPRRNEASPSE